MRFEILEDGVVVNTILANEEFMLEHFQPNSYRAVEEVIIEVPTPVELPKKITRLAFLNRFTDAEAVAIDLASIGATPEAASIRLYLKKVDAATFIDLDDASTRSGVQALETIGLLGTGRALEILDAPIQSTERP